MDDEVIINDFTEPVIHDQVRFSNDNPAKKVASKFDTIDPERHEQQKKAFVIRKQQKLLRPASYAARPSTNHRSRVYQSSSLSIRENQAHQEESIQSGEIVMTSKELFQLKSRAK